MTRHTSDTEGYGSAPQAEIPAQYNQLPWSPKTNAAVLDLIRVQLMYLTEEEAYTGKTPDSLPELRVAATDLVMGLSHEGDVQAYVWMGLDKLVTFEYAHAISLGKQNDHRSPINMLIADGILKRKLERARQADADRN